VFIGDGGLFFRLGRGASGSRPFALEEGQLYGIVFEYDAANFVDAVYSVIKNLEFGCRLPVRSISPG